MKQVSILGRTKRSEKIHLRAFLAGSVTVDSLEELLPCAPRLRGGLEELAAATLRCHKSALHYGQKLFLQKKKNKTNDVLGPGDNQSEIIKPPAE